MNRKGEAIRCLSQLIKISEKDSINNSLCIQALQMPENDKLDNSSLEEYDVTTLIKYLQKQQDIPLNTICQLELYYLPMLKNVIIPPICFETRLANDPMFFCSTIQSLSEVKEMDSIEEKIIKENNNTQILLLLSDWKIFPGTDENGNFHEDKFRTWFDTVYRILPQEQWRTADSYIAQVLCYAPKDPSGLWIHKIIVTVLDSPNQEELREYYSVALYNSRGVFEITDTGEEEQHIAISYLPKAQDLEREHFIRLASIFRKLSNIYKKEADSNSLWKARRQMKYED